MAGDIFISYRRTDEHWARLLHTHLKADGVDAWYDAQVGAGEDWRAATARALENSRIFVLLFSNAAAQSEDIVKELAAATLSKKLVVPVRLENIQPTGAFLYELASRNWINAFEETEATLRNLATSLAAMVKSANLHPSALPFDRGELKSLWQRRKPMLVFGGVIASIALLGTGVALMRPNSRHPVGDRIAFFGVDAPANDKDAATVAAATGTGILRSFAALQRNVAASADTEGTPPEGRIARALQLRATYAITGSAVRLGDAVSVSIRVEDAPSHTALWTEALDGPASNPVGLVSRVTALLNDRLTCIIDTRSSLATNDMRIVIRLPKACESVRFQLPGNLERWRELVALAPNSAWALTGEVGALDDAIPNAPPGDVESIKREATEAARKAEKLSPNLMEVQIARVEVAAMNGANLYEQEKIWLDGLKRAPNTANVNGVYANFLSMVGRAQSSLPYGRRARELDPLSEHKIFGLAAALEESGAPAEAETLLQQRHEQFPDDFEWPWRVASALFKSVGDVDAVLADPPASSSPELASCLKEIVRLTRQNNPTSRKVAAKRTFDCAAKGVMMASPARRFAAFLGDFDTIFASRSADGADHFYFFDPALAAFHADPRFEAFAQRTGLMDYWRTSGRLPDFCAIKDPAPLCRRLSTP